MMREYIEIGKDNRLGLSSQATSLIKITTGVVSALAIFGYMCIFAGYESVITVLSVFWNVSIVLVVVGVVLFLAGPVLGALLATIIDFILYHITIGRRNKR